MLGPWVVLYGMTKHILQDSAIPFDQILAAPCQAAEGTEGSFRLNLVSLLKFALSWLMLQLHLPGFGMLHYLAFGWTVLLPFIGSCRAHITSVAGMSRFSTPGDIAASAEAACG